MESTELFDVCPVIIVLTPNYRNQVLTIAILECGDTEEDYKAGQFSTMQLIFFLLFFALNTVSYS